MRALALAMMVVMLAGCGSTKLFGSRTPPDETQVIDGPTLAVPPDFELRPPSEGQEYETTLGAQKTAEAQVLLGGSVSATTAVSGSSGWLLQQAGAGDGNIREQLKKDAEAPTREDEKSFWQKIMGKKD